MKTYRQRVSAWVVASGRRPEIGAQRQRYSVSLAFRPFEGSLGRRGLIDDRGNQTRTRNEMENYGSLRT